MAYRVTPAHDDSVQIEFEVPIKGRQNPLFFAVPKLQYFPPEAADQFEAWMEEVKDEKVTAAKRDRLTTLKLIELLVPKHLDALSKLTNGELADISDHWYESSKTSVGESSASDDS